MKKLENIDIRDLNLDKIQHLPEEMISIKKKIKIVTKKSIVKEKVDQGLDQGTKARVKN